MWNRDQICQRGRGGPCRHFELLRGSGAMVQSEYYSHCGGTLLISPATINVASGYVVFSLHKVQCSFLRAVVV